MNNPRADPDDGKLNIAVVDQFTGQWKHPTQKPTVIKVLFCFTS